MILGIIGVGAVGGTLNDYLRLIGHETRLIDPKLALYDSLNNAEAVFVCVPVPSSYHGQDEKYLKEVFDTTLKDVDIPIFIRSTIVPNTCKFYSELYKKKVYHLPEFLTERTAFDDIKRQPMFGPKEQYELLNRIFGLKIDCTYTNEELELAKYTHNCFGALKVTYFNMIFDLCKKLNCDYEKIRKVVLGSGYINEPHTIVGLDGKRGFGGKCFPTNIKNFIEFADDLKEWNLWFLLSDIDTYNERIRN